jgi:hypothetical protein
MPLVESPFASFSTRHSLTLREHRDDRNWTIRINQCRKSLSRIEASRILQDAINGGGKFQEWIGAMAIATNQYYLHVPDEVLPFRRPIVSPHP